jgi:hypothetical protein
MLDLSHERDVIEELWDLVEVKVQLPHEEAEFLAKSGPLPRCPETKRRFHRFHFRGKAILYRRDERFGAFTRDVSREGIGFLSPIQLLPKERVLLRVVGTSRLVLEIARCRRLSPGCYQCGARFVPAD